MRCAESSIWARVGAVLLMWALAGVPLAAGAANRAPTPVPAKDSAAAEDAEPATDGGTIDGRVSSIDYKSGSMTVDVATGGAHRTYTVLVVPGTNIQGQKDFHTIADLKRGAHVQVLMSRHGATNTAQIIRLL